ncbi:hypothetical protein BT67DRAFT_200043 [Trichocladium antarcticum]|uniref:Uncharacterized protein n=1 Tax=Trichocladium antarcticum TaxID=1450529 RepID=A0AAN6UQV5_9PEZI|nr:hypothetical protein BT67DRAFT_200043 [Trichocladium antarcticum]
MPVVPGNDAPRGRYGCGQRLRRRCHLPGSSKRERTCSTCRLLTWPAGMGAARTWTLARGLQDQNATARFPALATAERVPRASAAARCKRWRPGRRPLERFRHPRLVQQPQRPAVFQAHTASDGRGVRVSLQGERPAAPTPPRCGPWPSSRPGTTAASRPFGLSTSTVSRPTRTARRTWMASSAGTTPYTTATCVPSATFATRAADGSRSPVRNPPPRPPRPPPRSWQGCPTSRTTLTSGRPRCGVVKPCPRRRNQRGLHRPMPAPAESTTQMQIYDSCWAIRAVGARAPGSLRGRIGYATPFPSCNISVCRGKQDKPPMLLHAAALTPFHPPKRPPQTIHQRARVQLEAEEYAVMVPIAAVKAARRRNVSHAHDTKSPFDPNTPSPARGRQRRTHHTEPNVNNSQAAIARMFPRQEGRPCTCMYVGKEGQRTYVCRKGNPGPAAWRTQQTGSPARVLRR